jgi:hypothetical protein
MASTPRDFRSPAYHLRQNQLAGKNGVPERIFQALREEQITNREVLINNLTFTEKYNIVMATQTAGCYTNGIPDKNDVTIAGRKAKEIISCGEALAYGYGGIARVQRISGAFKNTIKRGIREQAAGTRVRACGGGRPPVEENRPQVVEKILEIVNPATCGNPQKVLLYTTESLRKTAGKLSEDGIKASCVTVGKIPEDNGYSKQTNQKMLQAGGPNPDRNEQFDYINSTAQEYIARGRAVISVNTKKKKTPVISGIPQEKRPARGFGP